jgi:hypothetical protein
MAVTVMMSAWRLIFALGSFSMVDNKASSWAVLKGVGSDFMVVSSYGLRCGTIAAG